MLSVLHPKSPSADQKGLDGASGLRVRVETPAGVVIARLTVDTQATVTDVKSKVAKLAPT